MKGIILAGGSGTRLHPLTISISKQLMPIYNKPMIYYPLSTLIATGINEILIITTERDHELFWRLLGDGSKIGCDFRYKIQDEPKGLAEAFVIGEDFIGDDDVALILGDNIFYGAAFEDKLNTSSIDGGKVFAYKVDDPERYGVVEFDEQFKVLKIEEKPKYPTSDYAIPGLYFYDNTVVEKAKALQPSERGELEITDINKLYLEEEKLGVQVIDKGTAWFDTGTFDSLMDACEYVKVVSKRQGVQIGCIEEAAYKAGFIDKEQMLELAKPLLKSGYGKYLLNLR